jgi:hypothetical protein
MKMEMKELGENHPIVILMMTNLTRTGLGMNLGLAVTGWRLTARVMAMSLYFCRQIQLKVTSLTKFISCLWPSIFQ